MTDRCPWTAVIHYRDPKVRGVIVHTVTFDHFVEFAAVMANLPYPFEWIESFQIKYEKGEEDASSD